MGAPLRPSNSDEETWQPLFGSVLLPSGRQTHRREDIAKGYEASRNEYVVVDHGVKPGRPAYETMMPSTLVTFKKRIRKRSPLRWPTFAILCKFPLHPKRSIRWSPRRRA